MFDDKGNVFFSTVMLDWVEWEGPLVSGEEKARREGIVQDDIARILTVSDLLLRFAELSWRRQLGKDELSGYHLGTPGRAHFSERVIDNRQCATAQFLQPLPSARDQIFTFLDKRRVELTFVEIPFQ